MPERENMLLVFDEVHKSSQQVTVQVSLSLFLSFLLLSSLEIEDFYCYLLVSNEIWCSNMGIDFG